MSHDRRSVLAALGLTLPFGLVGASGAAAGPRGPLALRFRSFEEAVAAAFASEEGRPGDGAARPWRRIEVGHSELLESGVQGCHNDRTFAGFPASHLRIVRAGASPGPAVYGVRLYVHTVDVVWTAGRAYGAPGRPLDFARLPPAPAFESPTPTARHSEPGGPTG